MKGMQITSRGFVGGVVADDADRIIDACPIIGYMKGWTLDQARDYCKQRGWLWLNMSGDNPNGQS